MSDKTHEEFEAWCVEEVELPEGYELNWGNDSVRLMFKGWQASRESLVIELPAIHGDEYDPLANAEYREKCRDVIHAAGVKTK